LTFGQAIKEAAEKRGVSMYRLAKDLGTHNTRVSRVFKSKNLTERTLREYAKALGLDVEVRLVRRRK